MQRRARTVDWRSGAPPSGELASVVEALSAGELVALPTETVYGIAARADHAGAVERLARIKGRDPRQPLTWHVGDSAALERLPRVSPMARRLAEKYWPGPLTLVLPGVARGVETVGASGWTGVRRPAHAASEALLRAAPFAIVATSANLHGREPLRDVASILEVFGDELAFAIDGDAPRLGEASVVLRLGPGEFRLLREGILDAAALRRVAGLEIAFVCTGNTCRSPMAAGFARKLLAERLAIAVGEIGRFGFGVRSMGVYAHSGAPASEHAVDTMREQGIDLTGHRAACAVPEELAAMSRVYALTRSHLEAIRMLLPPGKDRHCALLDPGGRDVADPVGGTRADYEFAARQIRLAIEVRLDEWA